MAEQYRNLVELYERSCSRYADRPLFGTKRGGVWQWTSYGDFRAMVDRFRAGLASLGVGRGDRVAIVANNRVEWAVAAYASYGLEAAFVPMYQAQQPKEWQFILHDCGAKVVIAANEAVYEALVAMLPDLPELVHVIGLERPASDWKSFGSLLEAGSKTPVPARSPDPRDIAAFTYTSGTTGKPKGVLLSHENIASNLSAMLEIFSFESDDRSLAFLPWAHSYGQTEVHGLLSMGCAIAINDDLNNLLSNLAEVKPTILVAVPRIFNRIYDSVNQQIGGRPRVLQRVIRTGIRGAIKRAHGEHIGPIERLDLAFDDKIVFAKIREKLGGHLKYAISASATLGREVAEFIDALGITVYEGYGLTETSPIVSANFPGLPRKLGSVGRVLPHVRVVIDTSAGTDGKEGEIIVYGPNVMVGYHNRPEENAKAFTQDGGLRTGDLGYLDTDGCLYITGRIKEQYKLQNGKYVMPSPLEEELKLSPYVANVFIYGANRPFNVALVVIAPEAVRRWAQTEGLTLGPDLSTDENVRRLIENELNMRSSSFRGFERPRDFVIITDDFTVENGLLTPTLKLKRREVLARYGALVEELYKTAPPLAAAASV